MSLDIYLRLPGEAPVETREPYDRIFIRRDGATVEITRAEWDELYPGREPVVVRDDDSDNEVFHANITHNLGQMAAACPIGNDLRLYDVLWKPDEFGIARAEQLIEPLRTGLAELRGDRAGYEQFNPANGWGSYALLVDVTASYLAACERWPAAEVHVWR